MINNRQNGRRRGRGGGGGPRQGGGGGGQGQRDSGNRIDSRARGNAAQLLEKYRNMARDAQMSGDRVNTEYYLQFADHYFRVLADQRGRSDDQQQRQRPRDDFDQFGVGFDDGGDEFLDEGEAIRADEQVRGSEGEARGHDGRGNDGRGNDGRNGEGRNGEGRNGEGRHADGRPPREARRDDRRPREDRQADRRDDRQPVAEQEPSARVAQPANDHAEDAPAPRRRGRKPREEQAETPVAIDADRLPPAFGATAADAIGDDPQEEAPKPRRRRVRTAGVEAPQVG